MTIMDTSSSDETVSRNLLILKRLKALQGKKVQAETTPKPVQDSKPNPKPVQDFKSNPKPAQDFTLNPKPVQDFSKNAKSVEVQNLSDVIPAVKNEVEKKVESASNHNVVSQGAGEASNSKQKLKDILKYRGASRVWNDSVSSSDCSQDTTHDLMRRTKLQEYLFKSYCDKNQKSQENDSSSNCSDLNLDGKKSSTSSSSAIDFKYRKHRARFWDDENDECVPTEGLLHLKKPCIDEKNHSLYYDNHGRMDPIDWDTVIDKSKLKDEKSKIKTSKNRVVMGPAEAFLTKDAFLLEPIPEFSNAVENSVNENSTFKVGDNLQRVKNTRDFSPLLKIDRMVNKSNPEFLKVPSDVKKRLKSSKSKTPKSKPNLVDKINVPSDVQEKKIKMETAEPNKNGKDAEKLNENELPPNKVPESSEIAAKKPAELKPTDAPSTSTKKNEESTGGNERKDILNQDDEEMFQFENPKSQPNSGVNKKFNDYGKNKNKFDPNFTKSNEFKNNPRRYNNNKWNRKGSENSETAADINSNNDSLNPNSTNKTSMNRFGNDEYNKRETSNYRNKKTYQYEKSKYPADNAPNKNNNFNKNTKRSASYMNKLRRLNTLDSDDASSFASDNSSDSISAKFKALKKKLLDKKYLAETSRDVCCENSVTSTDDVDEKEFLLKECSTRYFNKPMDSTKEECSQEENLAQEQETLIKEVKTRYFNEETEKESLKGAVTVEISDIKTDIENPIPSEISEKLIKTNNIFKITEKSDKAETDFSLSNVKENDVPTKNTDEECLKNLTQFSYSDENSIKRSDKKVAEASTVENKDIPKLQVEIEKNINLENIQMKEEIIPTANLNEPECKVKNDDALKLQETVENIIDLDKISKNKETASTANLNEEYFKNTNQPSISNKSFNNEVSTTNIVVESSDNTEISFEKEEAEIQNGANPIKNIEENYVSCNHQSISTENDMKNEINFTKENNGFQVRETSENSDLEKPDVDEKINEQSFDDEKVLLSEFNNNIETVNKIVFCDFVEDKNESSVVIEEITNDSESKKNSIPKVDTKKPTVNVNRPPSPLIDTCMEIDGFDIVNMDQFEPFTALFGKLRSLKESGNAISQDFEDPDINMNGITERSSLQSIENGLDVSIDNNNYSARDGSLSSNMDSDEEILSPSFESAESTNTEENIFSSVNVNEINLDNCSLNQTCGDPYYGHLLIKKPENNSGKPGRMSKMSNALKNYKNRKNLENSEEKQAENKISEESKKRFHILNEIKKHQLHLSCKPLSK